MKTPRPVTALFLALTLAAGPAVLTACGSSEEGVLETGTIDDSEVQNTSGADEGDVERGGVPDVDDSGTGEGDDSDD
ncbi:hypothetical protein JD78_01333 [Modestobacter roseus]|uniref:Uncharacterized protein n=1 Tax=Modestobacter roseus TaxID=1181884 RepID=A0A562IPA3_9ACTN|nr:hypothetical protein [Modestobacter roseus]TWH72811.1 hypothetical protein JD78_01333 [Modestobacter roseus]